MTRRLLLCLSLAAVASFAAYLALRAPHAPAAPPMFEDVTSRLGIDFVHDAGPIDGTYFMPQSLGSGCALFDADGDGRLDLYLLNNGGLKGRPNVLYLQQPDGTFRDASAGSGLDFAGYCMGVAVGDIDNDGRADVLVTMYGGVKLFRNLGGAKFSDITPVSGLDNPTWAASAAFTDIDGDGLLDLVVVNYVALDPTLPCDSGGGRDYCAPRTFPGQVSRLFRNLGGGKFADVTLPSGLGSKAAPGLGVVCADFDGDGRQDIFVANDGTANHLWLNNGNGTFREDALARGVALNVMAQPEANMGVALGDIDGDGLADFVVSHLTEETPTLWRQETRGRFRDRTAPAGLAAPGTRGTGFGIQLADLDLDGRLDLVIVNGRISRGTATTNADLGPHWGRYAERNHLFGRGARGNFVDLSATTPALCATPNVARGLATGDIDGDGRIDLVVTSAGGRVKILRGVGPAKGAWLVARAVSKEGRDAFGAEVSVAVDGRRFLRVIAPSAGYLCSNDPRVHVGLGDVSRYDALRVTWADGSREDFPGGEASRAVELKQGTGTPAKEAR